MFAPYGKTGGSSILDDALRNSGPTLNEHARHTQRYIEVQLTPMEVEYLASLLDCERRAEPTEGYLDVINGGWEGVDLDVLQCVLDHASGYPRFETC